MSESHREVYTNLVQIYSHVINIRRNGNKKPGRYDLSFVLYGFDKQYKYASGYVMIKS